MNSLKTLTLVAVMAAVGYGVYASLNKRPDADSPVPLPAGLENPQVQYQAGATPATTPPASLAGANGAPGGLAATTAAIGTPNPNFATPGALTSAPPDSSVDSGTSPAASSPLAPPTEPVQAQYDPSIRAIGSPLAPANVATGSTLPGPPGSNPAAVGAASPSGEARYPESRLEGGFAVAGDTALTALRTSAELQPSVHAQFAHAMDRARAELEAGNVAPTHLALSEWYDLPGLAAEEHKQLNDLLDRLAGTVIYSNQFHYLDPYIVQQGDTLDRIAQQCQVSPRLLGKINGIESPSPLQPGETLKVIRGPFNAVVDTANLRMTLFLQGRYAGRFPIGLGADRAATPGEYQVTAVVENPQFQVDNRVIPGGDPSNPLGRYWIDLGNNLGLHGTNDPRVIGRADGRGCISLSPQDMDHLCDILAPGSKVQIRK